MGFQQFAKEPREAQCKFYVEPSLKKAIQNFADREGQTFSEACRSAMLNSEEIQHELKLIGEQ